MTHSCTVHVTAPLCVVTLRGQLSHFTSEQNSTPLTCLHSVFTPLQECIHEIFCDFSLCFPFLGVVSPSWQWGKSGQAQKEGMAQKLLSSPSPCSSGVFTLVHYSAFSSSCRQKWGMWKCIPLFLTRLFFFFSFSTPPPRPNSLWVKTSLTCTKNSHFQVFLIFDSASVWALIFLFALWVSLLFVSAALLDLFYLPHCTRVRFACTEHNV